MDKKNKDEIVHTYDGIQECDNDLPRWWLAILYGTMIFGVVYSIYYHFGGPGISQVATLEQQLAEQAKVAAAAPKPVDDQSQLVALVQSSEAASRGEKVFTARCSACHGALGQGLVGPNLTDDHWIHGGTPGEIKKVIQKGVLEKGMLAWEAMLPPNEIDDLVAYIWKLHGTNPAGAKAAEGQVVQRER